MRSRRANAPKPASHIAVPALDSLADRRCRNLIGDLDVPHFAVALRGEAGEQLRDYRYIAYLMAAQALTTPRAKGADRRTWNTSLPLKWRDSLKRCASAAWESR
jgi:hypothetical protein